MDGEGISDGLSFDRKVEIKVRKNGRKDEVIVEKSAAEGLPKGWIKKLVTTIRTDRKIRRDPYFIDPKSEYRFQSFKDASRYVETGKIGKNVRKLSESNIEDDDSGNGKTILLLESAEKESTDDLNEKEKNMNIYVRNRTQRNLTSSDENSENCKENSDLEVHENMGKKEDAKDPIEMQSIAKRVTRSQAKASKNEEDGDSKTKTPPLSKAKTKERILKSRLRSASSQDLEKESIMKPEEIQDSTAKRITRSKAKVVKNELSNSVIRRVSKRLAGIELEPTPELKIRRTKTQRVVPPPDDGTAEKCTQPVDPAPTPLSKDVAKSCSEHSSPKPYAVASTSNRRMSADIEVKLVWSGDEKKKMKMPLVIPEVEVNPVFHLDGYKQKEEISSVSPLCQTSSTKREKTAAGKRLAQLSPKTSPKVTKITTFRSSNKGNHLHPHHSGNSNANQKRIKLSNEGSNSSVVRGTSSEVMEKNTNSISSTTLADLWKDPCIAFAIKTLTGESPSLPTNTASISSYPNNNHGKQKGVSFFPETSGNVTTGSQKPEFLPDIWKDPCIDFAIKTLTGAIPVGLDEAFSKPKSEGVTVSAPLRLEPETRERKCDYLVQQCSKKNVGKSGDLRFP